MARGLTGAAQVQPVARRSSVAGLTVAMTDLFFSAGVTLMIVLALSESSDPAPLPVQAALVAFCPETADGPYLVGLASARSGGGAAGPMVQVASQKDLAALQNLPNLMPQMLQVIALSPRPGTAIDAGCTIRFARDIVEAHNRVLAEADAALGPRTVYAVVPVPAPLALPGGRE